MKFLPLITIFSVISMTVLTADETNNKFYGGVEYISSGNGSQDNGSSYEIDGYGVRFGYIFNTDRLEATYKDYNVKKPDGTKYINNNKDFSEINALDIDWLWSMYQNNHIKTFITTGIGFHSNSNSEVSTTYSTSSKSSATGIELGAIGTYKLSENFELTGRWKLNYMTWKNENPKIKDEYNYFAFGVNYIF